MANFELAMDMALNHEGGYVNNKYDSGGETNYGITKEVAREAGYKGDMKDLSLALARAIYKKNYWDKLKLDKVENQIVAEITFDLAVNMGQGTGAKYLQEAYNFTTKENIKDDGIVGSKTLKAINSIKGKKGTELLVLCLNALAGEHDLECCRKSEKNETFILGWLRRRNNYLRRFYETTNR